MFLTHLYLYKPTVVDYGKCLVDVGEESFVRSGGASAKTSADGERRSFTRWRQQGEDFEQ